MFVLHRFLSLFYSFYLFLFHTDTPMDRYTQSVIFILSFLHPSSFWPNSLLLFVLSSSFFSLYSFWLILLFFIFYWRFLHFFYSIFSSTSFFFSSLHSLIVSLSVLFFLFRFLRHSFWLPLSFHFYLLSSCSNSLLKFLSRFLIPTNRHFSSHYLTSLENHPFLLTTTNTA